MRLKDATDDIASEYLADPTSIDEIRHYLGDRDLAMFARPPLQSAVLVSDKARASWMP